MSAPKQVPWNLTPTPDDITDAAIRTVAAHAADADDARHLLDALGLTQHATQTSHHTPAGRRRRTKHSSVKAVRVK